MLLFSGCQSVRGNSETAREALATAAGVFSLGALQMAGMGPFSLGYILRTSTRGIHTGPDDFILTTPTISGLTLTQAP